MTGSADSDPSSNLQLELPFAAGRFKGRDLVSLLNDPIFQEWIASLWNRHQPFLLELAHYYLRDWDRAEDVVQEMWADFIKSLPRFVRKGAHLLLIRHDDLEWAEYPAVIR